MWLYAADPQRDGSARICPEHVYIESGRSSGVATRRASAASGVAIASEHREREHRCRHYRVITQAESSEVVLPPRQFKCLI